MCAVNYLRTLVHRAEDRTGLKDVRLATSLVYGSDLFHCLERTIDELRDRGWVVEDLEAFQIGVTTSNFLHDDGLRELCHMAEAGGFAYRITEAVEFEPVGAEEPCRPLGS